MNGYHFLNMMGSMLTLILVVFSFFATLLLIRAVNYFGLSAWRRSSGQHWTLRARLLYPIRVTAGLSMVFLPVDIYLLARTLHLSVPAWEPAGSSLLAAWLGSYWLTREIFPETTFREWLTSWLMILLGRVIPFALFLWAIVTMPKNFGAETWLIAGLLFLLLATLRLGGMIRFFSLSGLLRPADDRLAAIVAEVAGRMDVQPRRIWVLPGAFANAYALPLSRELIFSQGLLRHLSDAQIAAVTGHELAHLTEPRRVLFLRLMQPMILFPLVFIRPLIATGGNGLMWGGGLLAVTLIMRTRFRRMGRRMEVRADAIASANEGKEAAYAQALQRIYEVNQMPAVMSGRRRIHPNLYDRLVAAGITPDFPKPEPPQRFTLTRILLYLSLPALSFTLTVRINNSPHTKVRAGASGDVTFPAPPPDAGWVNRK